MECRRLERSRENRMVCGVCGGLGDYLNVDPTIVRLVMVILMFAQIGILGYIIAAVIMPEEQY